MTPEVAIRHLAREHGPDAIRILAEIMSDPEQKASDRVAAIKVLLDRGYGSPIQQHLVTERVDVGLISDEQLLAIIGSSSVGGGGRVIEAAPGEVGVIGVHEVHAPALSNCISASSRSARVRGGIEASDRPVDVDGSAASREVRARFDPISGFCAGFGSESSDSECVGDEGVSG